MGKSTTPTKWFKAVKKAFRSPSKERPSPKDTGDTDEKLHSKQDFPPVSYAAPTPHPLPSFEGVAHNKSQQQSHGTPPQALPTTPDQAGTDPAMTDKKPKEVEEPKQQQHSRNGNTNGVKKHQEEGGASTLGIEDEAAIRIEQRFLRNPMALKGLIRLQALVRGQLVRRQATTTLRTMEAIVRVQALFRGRRVRMSKEGRAVKTRTSRIQRLSSRVRKDARREKLQEMEAATREAEHEANKRKRRTAYLLTQQLKRGTPNRSSSFIDCDPEQQPHEGWAWLELWTNAKAWESRQLEAASAATHESKLDPKDYIEIIPGSSRRTTSDYHPAGKEVDFRTLNKQKYHENGNHGTSHSKAVSKAFEISEAGFSSKKSTSPHLTTPSPAASEDAAIARIDLNLIPGSPNPSETSVKLGAAADGNLPLAMEQVGAPEVTKGSPTPSDSFSTSNEVHDHQPAGTGAGDAAAQGEAPTCEIGNGEIPENGLHENGDCTKSRKDAVESPGSSKRETCRYMAATASAKAKFRSTSSPKTKGSSTTPEAAEAPAAATPLKHRHSIGGGVQGMGGKAAAQQQSPNKTPVAFGSGKTTNRRSPSPKASPKEKPRSVDVGYDGLSLARRNSLGSGDDKRWRT